MATAAKKQQRRQAFSKPGTGQFTPGRASKSPTQGTNRPAADPVPSRFVTLPSGKTGTVVDVQPSLQPVQVAPPSDMFALALQKVQQEEVSGLRSQGILNAPAPVPPPASQPATPERPSLPSPPPSPSIPTSIFGARADAAATALLNKGFDFVQSLGNGDFARGLASIVVLPVTAAPQALGEVSITGKFAGSLPGVVTDTTLASGGVKASQTIIQSIVSKFKPSKAISSIKPFVAIGGLIFLAHSIIKDATQTGAVGVRDIKEEAGGMASTGMRDMLKAGDRQSYEEFKTLWQDLKNTKESWAPYGIGAVKNTDVFVKAVDTSVQIYDKHYDLLDQVSKSSAPASIGADLSTAQFWQEYHAQVEANITAEQKARVDYFNSQKLLAEQRSAEIENQLIAARSQASAANRKADLRQAQELAAFWLKYKQDILSLEAKDRQDQADFWMQYRKEIAKIQLDNSRSNLSFGLFR